MLLEPISELVVTVPEANQGDIMGDLNGKRGRIQGSASVGGGEVEIVATVPTSEILRYAIDLRSMTGGRGRFTARHSHYDPVPAHLADKISAVARLIVTQRSRDQSSGLCSVYSPSTRPSTASSSTSPRMLGGSSAL